MRWARNLFLSAALFLPAALLAQGETGRITGVVSDSGSGQPITSATVLVVGTTFGATTDTEGRYAIAGVPAGTHEIRVQRIGFRPQTATIAVAGGQTVARNFQLLTQTVQLEAVVAVGYGTQARRDVTGAVSTVTTEALERAPISTIDQVLQGTSPGVQVTSASGEPGAALSIRIRGTSSITGNSEPLYVIDGFPIENDIEGSSVGNGGRTRTTPPNPLVTLNPSDIESISILKDASSTAIYGARGANGVVIITTKQGRGAKPTFGFDYYTGLQEVTKTYDMLSAAEYIDYANTFAANASAPYTPFSPAQKDSILAAGTNTNWQEEIFQTGKVNNFQLSIRGATTAASPTRYSLSGGLFNQEGIVLGSGLRRLSGRLNLNQALGSRFEFGASLSANQARSKAIPTAGQQNAGAGAISAAIQYVPILPVRRANGTYSYINTDLNAFNSLLDAPQTPNPVSLLEVMDSLSDTRLLSNVFAQAKLVEGLDLRVSFGADYADRWRYTYYPRTTLRGEQAGGEALRASASTSSWLNENTLTYQREFGTAHKVNALAGYTRQKTDLDGENISASDFVSDITGYNDIGAGRLPGIPGSRRTTQALESYLSRLNYSLLDRYLFTATYRADGNSRFAEGKKWGAFPSAAFAWRASSEPWMPDYGWLGELKFRASYGLVGNPSIRPYQSLARLNDQGYSFGGTPYAGYYVTAVGNESLTWETTRGTDLGVDVEFLDRFALTADWYKKRTSNLLLQIQLEMETGFESALANRGKVDNAGVEVGLEARIFEPAEKNGFGWRANFNYATNRNRVVDLGGPEEIEADLITTDYNLPGTKIRVGHPIGVFYGFKSLGVIPDAAAASQVKYTNFNNNAYTEGDMLVADIDGDNRITLNDRTIIGNPTPKFTVGLTNTFSYYGFELTGLLQGSYGGDLLNVNRIRTESSPRVNVSRERYYDAWSPTNRNAKFPQIGENPNQVGTNNFTSNLLEDGSYLRLQTITLSWGVPEQFIGRTGVTSARVYVTGTNLFTITDYSGYNPDVSGQSVGNTNRGIDIGTYPLSRGVTFGLNFNY